MSTNRRLSIVGAVLALTSVVACSQVWGDSVPKPRQQPVVNGSQTLSGKMEPTPTRDLAASKFAAQAIVTYRTELGELLFALQIQPKLETPASRPCDYLFLVDTSASQVGLPLIVERQLTEELIKQAKPGDRFAIRTLNIPSELASRDLTRGFKDPQVREDKRALADAVEKLRLEVPLGAADLQYGLDKAIGTFTNRSNRHQAIVLLGDGMSAHNPVTEKDRARLSEKMVQNRIAFYTVPVGPRLDPNNLHGFSCGTGGTVARVRPTDSVPELAKRLQDLVAAPILYANEFKLTGALATELYPAKLPPLRSDAPTLLVGRVKPNKTIGYTIEGTVAGKTVHVQRTDDLPEPEADNFFLVSMLEQWKKAKDQPALMRADRALAYAQEINELARDELLGQAQMALMLDKVDAAGRLFEQARKVDPSDVEAAGGLKLVGMLKDGKVTKDQLRKQMDKREGNAGLLIEKTDTSKTAGKAQFRRDSMKNLIGLAQAGEQVPATPAQPGAIVPPTSDESLIQQQRLRQQVEEQRIDQVVTDALRQAGQVLRTDPDAAHDLLRRTLTSIAENPDLREGFRQSMLNRLEPALRRITIEGASIRRDQEERERLMAQSKKTQEGETARYADQERMRERMRVFHNLMAQARFEDAYKQGLSIVQDAVHQGTPVPPTAVAAMHMGLLAHHLREAREIQRVREERYLATMLQVERSHVPFPDEPPVQFPPAASWRALSSLRKERYESSGLMEDDPVALKKIRDLQAKLAMPITIDSFDANTPLREALGFLSERYGLTILIDTQAFKDDLQINEIESGPVKLPKMVNVSLGTVMRLLLSQQQATFLIRRDYVEVTTPQRQAAEKTVRAYPVADLVTPIPNSVNQQAVNQTANNSILGFGNVGLALGGAIGLGGVGALGGLGALGVGGLGALGGGLGALGVGGLGALGGGLGALGALGGGLGALGALGGGLGQMGLGGGFAGVQGMGGTTPQGLGQGGQLGGQFGLQGGNTSRLLITLITQVVGKPEDWAPVVQQPMANVGQGAAAFIGQQPGIPPVDPSQGAGDPNQAGSLGYYPPAQALVVKATSRIHTRLGGGLLGPKPPAALALADRPRDGALVFAPGKKPARLGVDDRLAANKALPKNAPPQLAKNTPDHDAKKVWQDALARGVEEPGLIIATADFLVEREKFDHAAEFLKANLRHGLVVRPWVYDALSLALKLSKGSIEDIERAELSFLDMEPQDVQGYLRASRLMADNKQWERALAFCRQAARLEPNAPDAYEQALVCAERGKDTAAMEWSAANLLSRDWPMDNDKLHANASDRLKTLKQLLQRERRSTEADRMENAALKHRARDLVVQLSWQGDAGLALEVKEPIGTVCSFQQRQTPGGGTLLGATLADRSRETYVASEAFAGDYQITIRRNYGRPLGSKATVQVVEHQGTPQERIVLRESISFDRSHTLKVQLKEGRRTSVAQVSPHALARKSVKETAGEGGDILNKLRALADPDFAPTGAVRGGVSALGTSAVASQPQRIDPRKTLAQSAIQEKVNSFVNTGVEMTLQPIISSDNQEVIGVSLNPVVQTLDKAGSTAPVIVNPVIPGGWQASLSP